MTDNLFTGKEILVAENENYAMYSDNMTRSCTEEARKPDINGMELRGWTVLRTVRKHMGVPELPFIIFDKDHTPQKDTVTIWDMYDWISVKKMMMLQDYDIVEMAEKLRKERKDD